MNTAHLKYRDFIIAIQSELPIFLKHFEYREEYRPILNVLKEEFPSLDNLPHQKDLLQHLKMSRSALMSRLHDLYRDFQTAICEEGAYPVSKTVIYFHIRTLNDHWMIGVQGLENLPRPGDRFSVDFIKDEIG